MKNVSGALEATGMLLAGVSVVMLMVASMWSFGIMVADGRQVSSEAIGDAPNLGLSFNEVAAVSQQFSDTSGRVAGIVDDATVEEVALRNDVAQWLIDAREQSNMATVYRDSLLDRTAQAHAKALAGVCSDTRYNDWQSVIGTEIDQGYVYTYSEAAFAVNAINLSTELPLKSVDYQRLFTDYRAYGVGVASTDDSCGKEYVITLHLADVQ